MVDEYVGGYGRELIRFVAVVGIERIGFWVIKVEGCGLLLLACLIEKGGKTTRGDHQSRGYEL